MLLFILVAGGVFWLGYTLGSRRSAPGIGALGRRGHVGWEPERRDRLEDARIVRDIDSN